MKCLFLSIEKWESKVTDLATRGNNIVTDPMRKELLLIQDTCAILITYENSDTQKSKVDVFNKIMKEIVDLGRNNAFIVPFAHLSSNLGDASEAKTFLEELQEYLNAQEIQCQREHFGSDKRIELILNSHPGCVRFREF